MLELSRQTGDYWVSTTTSAGSSEAIVDTAMIAKANDWISDAPQEMYDRITSGTYDEEERKISSLDNTTGTLTPLAHGGTIASGVTYEVHRLWSASEKRRALIYAARRSYPYLFNRIKDESKVSGNWLKDGSFEVWTSSSALTHWTTSASTIAQTTTAGLFKHGNTSCKISTAAGYIEQTISNWDDLKKLAGKTVTFTAQGHCDAANCLRLAIYDGTTTTYSDYHDGDSGWTTNSDPLSVTATIQNSPTAVTFRIYHASAVGTSYVDDARVIGGINDKVYIGDLNLEQDAPHSVSAERSSYSNGEPWIRLHEYTVDNEGYLYISGLANGYTLRIEGIAPLDFLASGVSSTSWAATIDIDSPQTDILVAEAVMYLYIQMISPNYTSGERDTFAQMLQYWENELAERRAKFGMIAPQGTVKRG